MGEPDAALANHLIMGPVILARAGLEFAIKVHGSDLSYTVRPHPDRFVPFAREGTDAASGLLVGSRYTAEDLWKTVGDPGLPDRTRLGPPGVDTQRVPAAARGRGRCRRWSSWPTGSRTSRRTRASAGTARGGERAAGLGPRGLRACSSSASC